MHGLMGGRFLQRFVGERKRWRNRLAHQDKVGAAATEEEQVQDPVAEADEAPAEGRRGGMERTDRLDQIDHRVSPPLHQRPSPDEHSDHRAEEDDKDGRPRRDLDRDQARAG